MNENTSTPTIEELQAQILNLTEQVERVTVERDKLSEDNKNLSVTVEQVRTLNQQLMLRIPVAQQAQPSTEPEPEPVPTCEEFAQNITI